MARERVTVAASRVVSFKKIEPGITLEGFRDGENFGRGEGVCRCLAKAKRVSPGRRGRRGEQRARNRQKAPR